MADQVALKVIERSPDRDTLDSIEAERRGSALQERLAAVDSRVVRIYETGDVDDYFYVAMEYIEGEDLAELILRGPDRPPAGLRNRRRHLRDAGARPSTCRRKSTARSTRESSTATSSRATSASIPKAGVRVLDFGIAKALSLSRRLTRNEFGSVPYASPERLDSGEVDRMSDLWSVAVVLYEMVTGHAALSGGQHGAAGEDGALAHPAAARAGTLPRAAAAHPDQGHGARSGASLSIRRRARRRSAGVRLWRESSRQRKKTIRMRRAAPSGRCRRTTARGAPLHRHRPPPAPQIIKPTGLAAAPADRWPERSGFSAGRGRICGWLLVRVDLFHVAARPESWKSDQIRGPDGSGPDLETVDGTFRGSSFVFISVRAAACCEEKL